MSKAREIRALLLAAGLGTRLNPLTDNWPKCLMPIGKRPLLEYWLGILYLTNIRRVLVNIHHHSQIVKEFLGRPRFIDWVQFVNEKDLLGTAGTLRANSEFFQECTTLLVHADNWCQFNFSDFQKCHYNRPPGCVMTMMTFESTTPETCGIIETDDDGIVLAINEKSLNPSGKIANAAVYLLEPEVVEWVKEQPRICNFSTEVIPNFLGRIATWHNSGIHKDIGALPMLRQAQFDPQPIPCWPHIDVWQKEFMRNPIHKQIATTLV